VAGVRRSSTPVRASEATHAATRPAGAATAASDGAGFTPASAPDLESEGAAHHPCAALSIFPGLLSLAKLAAGPGRHPATRPSSLARDPRQRRDLKRARSQRRHDRLSAGARTPFDKSPATNWSLGWHRDCTIVARERHDMPGYCPWSRKGRLQHVEPPHGLIEAMLTLRIHLDDLPTTMHPC
jgi:hypothetical protein